MTILDLTYEEFCIKLKDQFSLSPFYGKRIYREAFQNGALTFKDPAFSSLKMNVINGLRKAFAFVLSPVLEKKEEEGVVKWITSLHDGARIESVVIPMEHYVTLCISTQVGCKMGCRYCRTGTLGFFRNLTADEIVSQVLTAKSLLNLNIRNVVFMGMGEALDNIENTLKAILVMTDQRGLNIAESRVTLSTVGIPEAIDALSRHSFKKLNLAVSLNAPNNSVRSFLMPINRKYPLEELRRSLVLYQKERGRCLWIQYVLIRSINDSREHADELAEFLEPLNVKVNVIPYNEGGMGIFESPTPAETDLFISYLIRHRLFVRRRRLKGGSLLAACGQLGGDRLVSGL